MKLNLVLKVCPEESISDLKSNMSQLLDDPTNSDFEIVCQGETKFKVHKLILATRSSVFKAMFNSVADNKESQNGQVNVPDIDPLTMKTLLKFIYTENTECVLNYAMSILYLIVVCSGLNFEHQCFLRFHIFLLCSTLLF